MPDYPEDRSDVVDRICQLLEEGKGLTAICKEDGMPARTTVWRWAGADDEVAGRIRESREIGYFSRAERVIEEIRTCSDPIKARLLFDAERWYLGKLSKGFAERPVSIGVVTHVDSSDAFAAIAGALQEAAAARAGLAASTSAVVIEGEARPADTPRQLADLAGDGRPGMGQDPCGR